MPLFKCDGCGTDVLTPRWFHDRVNDHDLCEKCRANWDENGPMGKDERYAKKAVDQ